MGRVSDSRERLLAAMTELMWENSYSTATVDAICSHAKVKKGSFYYFFDSKSDLAVAALEHDWNRSRMALEQAFSQEIPPLERLTGHFAAIYEQQQTCRKRKACSLGCPYITVASEVCTQDQKILARIRLILDKIYEYFERAVYDARDTGVASVPDPSATARCIFSLYEGALMLARVQNNLEPLRALPAATHQLLGVSGNSLGNRSAVDVAA